MTTIKSKLFLVLMVLFIMDSTIIRAQVEQSDKLETFAEFDEHMGLGVSVTSDNRVFVSFPDFNADKEFALVEVKEDGKKLVYPDLEWNTKAEEGSYEDRFLRIQDIE